MKKPVFIIGCPRSGTTMLLDILSSHEDFAWISQFVNKLPSKIYLGYIQRLYNNYLFGFSISNICNIVGAKSRIDNC